MAMDIGNESLVAKLNKPPLASLIINSESNVQAMFALDISTLFPRPLFVQKLLSHDGNNYEPLNYSCEVAP